MLRLVRSELLPPRQRARAKSRRSTPGNGGTSSMRDVGGPSRPLRFIACAMLLGAALWAQNLSREGSDWVLTLNGTLPAAARLRVNAQGPVLVQGGNGREISYTAKLSVRARSEEEARRILSQYSIPVAAGGDTVLINPPGGTVMEHLTIKTPRQTAAYINTSDGDVEADGLDGPLQVNSVGGALKCDRIRGDCSLNTGGGNIQVGEVNGELRCATAGGSINVKNAGRSVVLQTGGGEIELGEAGGMVRAETVGGSIRISSAGGAVTATTGGGPIQVGKAGGVVTARNVAGFVQIGAAAGVLCESGSGGVRVSNIAGPMRVSTTVGNIVASLLGGSTFRDSFIETANGDITVMIPSNLGVTIMAQAQRRIVSDFNSVGVRMQGPEFIAEGQINGGGPVLRISGTGGTISLKRQ